jgi:hypothetical protein
MPEVPTVRTSVRASLLDPRTVLVRLEFRPPHSPLTTRIGAFTGSTEALWLWTRSIRAGPPGQLPVPLLRYGV